MSGLAALTALVLFDYEASSRADVVLHIGRMALIVMTALALGLALGAARRREGDEAVPGPVTDTLVTSGESRTGAALDERATLAFARSLLAATSADAFQATVEGDLPRLLGGRKVWIAWQHAPRPTIGEPAPGKPTRDTMLADAIQEWTTFPLKLGDQRLGLLGVESAGGLAPAVRERIQTVLPLIAQALQSVQAVDLFREASLVDLLTGAATRREGLNRLQTEIKRAQRTRTPMAVLMVDLDHFKTVNDRFGHAVGDSLLTAIGETLKRTLRASDVRCRWGGEEFLVVLPETTLTQAQVVATNLLHHIGATMVQAGLTTVSSTASIGLTISRPGETDINRIVARADMGLYRAKNAGRSCIRVVLGGFDGQPIGATDRPPNEQRDNPDGTLPFPDRRNPDRRDRRRVSTPGRRKTDLQRPADGPTPVRDDETKGTVRGNVTVASGR